MALLEVKDLSFRFPNGFTALDSVSFSLNKGELLVISGRNGSGKTVLLRCLKGLYKPSGGSIRLQGDSLGLVFQDPDSQIVGQSVERDIAFGLENLSVPRKEIEEKTDQVLDTLDLTEHRKQRPRTLSGGEKRRLTIAGVLVMNPSVIALDEPFANLDFPGVIQVLEKIVLLKQQGHTILVVTHELDKILAHADLLMLMDKGRIVCFDTPVEAARHAPSSGVRIPLELMSIEEMTWLKQ